MFVRLTVAGLALGALAAVPLTRALESLLFEISATDPLVFAGAALVLGLAALAAAWVPAHSASRVEPLKVLRK